MVTTSLAVAALTAALNAAPSPQWQTDYAKAVAVAAAEKKPMAVFVGVGGNKLGRMLADGTIPADAARLLRESYVCVTLDAATGAGKELSGRFEMPEGLVISGPGGDVQALRHGVTVSGPDLTRQLDQFANPGRPAPVSTAAPAPAATYPAAPTFAPVVVSGGCPGGNCRAVVPAANYVYPAAPAFPFGGGCANGQCNIRR